MSTIPVSHDRHEYRGSWSHWKYHGHLVGSFLAALFMVGLVAISLAPAEDETPIHNVTSPLSKTDKTSNTNDHRIDDADIAALQDKRIEAAKELAAVSRSGDLRRDAPSGVSQEQLSERHALLQQIVRAYDQAIDEYHRLEQARERHGDVTKSNTEWNGFSEPAPYSILLADELWNTAFSLRLAVEGLQSQLNMIELRFGRARELHKSAEERLRQASERVEAAKDPAALARAQWARDMEALRSRTGSIMLTAAERSRKRIEEELAEARDRLAFAQRQLQTAEEHVRFTEEDLNKVRARLTQERQGLDRELQHTIAAEHVQSHALEEAERQLDAMSGRQASRSSGKLTGRMGRLRRAVELRRVQSDNMTLNVDLLKQMLDIVEGERQLWESRFALAQGVEPSQAREAYRQSDRLLNSLHASGNYLQQQVTVVSGERSEQDNRLSNASVGDDHAHLQAVLDAHRQREALYNRVLQRVDQATRFVERWQSEFKEKRKKLPLSARLTDWAKQAFGLGTAFWNFEVFAAEDTIEVEGKKITGRRSITVGKILTALGILLIGYWICLYLARLISALVVRRLGVTPELANLLRQWTQAFLIIILILISLISVKIPLTIFAFLGGAFAIGLGFGAQNLLKNVISGILLLIERPLRVGDLIEVDNIRGRVMTIGLRSSTIRDAKGVETLIPNSNLLDRNLTNWTYSSPIGRFSLRVGAPYGSNQVGEVLIDIARQHPRVLKLPSPQALLEEFGDKAVIFTLHYWLDIGREVEPAEVASDLRYMIEKRFMETGLKLLPAG
ncbi:mechanosensitive ion channel domain-containing protein [Nitrospira sp. Nam74]